MSSRLVIGMVVVFGVAGGAGCGGGEDDTVAVDAAVSTSGSSGSPSRNSATQSHDDNGRGGKRERVAGGSVESQRLSEPIVATTEADRKAGTKVVEEAYGGLAGVVEADVVSVEIDPRRGLEDADGSPALQEVCSRMGDQARQQTVEYVEASARLSDVDWTCEKAVGLLARRIKQSGGAANEVQPGRVVGINVDGKRATATLSFGKRQPLRTTPLVKENGDWKLAATPSSRGTR